MIDEGVSHSSHLRGGLSLMSLVDLIQFLHAGGNGGELELSAEGPEGPARIFFQKGQIVHVEEGGRVGVQALVDLLERNRGEFFFTPGVASPCRTVELPLQQVLMEAVRLKDESVRDRGESHDAVGVCDWNLGCEEQFGEGRDKLDRRLAAAVEAFRERLGAALVACDIWGPNGLSLAGYQARPGAVALFGDITSRLIRSLADGGFPTLGRYYLIELTDKKIVCVLVYKYHHWGALVDLEKVNLGILLGIAIPKAIDDLRVAIDA